MLPSFVLTSDLGGNFHVVCFSDKLKKKIRYGQNGILKEIITRPGLDPLLVSHLVEAVEIVIGGGKINQPR